MAIDSIGNSTLTQQLSPTNASVARAGRDADGDNDNSGAGRAEGNSPVANAIAQALTSIGVTAASGTTASAAVTGAGSDARQATRAFTQALFAALHAQDQGAGGDGVQQAGGGHHRHGGGAGKIGSGLQNLIQQLGAGSSSASAGSGASTSTSTSTADNSTLAALQGAFDSLVSANGGTPGSASLSSFLQSMQQNLHAAPSAGNVVNTSA